MGNFFSFSKHEQHQSCGVRSGPFNFSVRVAQQKDLSDLVEVLSSSFHPRTGAMRWLFPILRMGVYEDLRQRLKSPLSPDYMCLVAVPSLSANPSSRTSVIGTVEVTLRSTNPLQFRSHPYPYLSNLAVRSDSRRQGIARKLLDTCEKMVADGGFQNLYLHVLEDNHEARRLYLKAGYRLQTADPLWRCWLLKQPRRLLLYKPLVHAAVAQDGVLGG